MAGQPIGFLSEYINSEKALAIISGILISVIIAFAVGAIVQYLARLVFSFRQHRTLKYYGAVFGGLSIAAMTYFMIIKGAKGATFITEDMLDYMKANMLQILLISFAGWTIVLQLLTWIFRIDIPKIIVLVGTFGLAMAFAGNDLVNFIGVPLAGFQSFKAWIASGAAAPDAFSMEMLKGKVATPSYMLLIAGLIMIVTLITSRKARNVVATTVDLSRQSEGDERFGSSMLSRIIVRKTIQFNNNIRKVIPNSFNSFIDKRFEHPKGEQIIALEDEAAFDKIRAAINLIVSGILISVGTSLKLPLSTTYVTFMVAMGTSLADRAWGRESAVYRISGVFAVIGGWFLTALVAFTVSAIIALIITLSGNFMIFIFIALAIFTVVRTHTVLRKKAASKVTEDEESVIDTDGADKIIDKTKKQVISAVLTINQVYSVALESFLLEDRNHLKDAVEMKNDFDKKTKKMKNKVSSVIDKLYQSNSLDLGHFYVQLVDYMREVSHSLTYLVDPLREHLDNNHKPFKESQIEELTNFLTSTNNFVNLTLHLVKEQKYEELDNAIKQRDELIQKLSQLEKAQIKRIKNKDVNMRNSVLFFNIVSETKNLLMHYINLIKAHRDFTTNTKK
jgi:hypothetical protein